MKLKRMESDGTNTTDDGQKSNERGEEWATQNNNNGEVMQRWVSAIGIKLDC